MRRPTFRLMALLGALLACALAPSAHAVEAGVVGIPTLDPASEARDSAALLSTAPAGRRWVRVMMPWPLLQPDGPRFAPGPLHDLDVRIRNLAKARLNVLLMVTAAPQWSHPGRSGDAVPPADPRTYAAMMAALAKRYAGQVQAVEVWNEPDDEEGPREFWRGPPDPKRYTALLRATYAAVKATGPRAPLVLVGGLVGNHYAFLEAMYAAGAKGSFDAVGVHLDTACRQTGPDDTYREGGRIGRFAFSGYREVHGTMLRHGEDKPIWVTELGWSASPELCDQGAMRGRGPGGVSEGRQAMLLKRAYDCLAHDRYIGPAFWWSLRDYGSDPKEISHTYGLVAWTGRPRPAYVAFQHVFKQGPSGALCGDRTDYDKPTVVLRAPPIYSRRLPAFGAAVDASTSVRRLELYDGYRLVRTVRGANLAAFAWPDADQLTYGDHVLQLRAYDEAGNMGWTSAVVHRTSPTGRRSVSAAVGFDAFLDRYKRVNVDATVGLPADGSYHEAPRGRLELRFKRRGGRALRVRRNFTYGPVYHVSRRLKKGVWRVQAVLDVDAPYRRTRTRAFTFRVR